MQPKSPGRYRFVTIATNDPMQGASASDTPDAKAARVGEWAAIVTDVDVVGETAP
jgi:hypothetical protein